MTDSLIPPTGEVTRYGLFLDNDPNPVASNTDRRALELLSISWLAGRNTTIRPLRALAAR